MESDNWSRLPKTVFKWVLMDAIAPVQSWSILISVSLFAVEASSSIRK